MLTFDGLVIIHNGDWLVDRKKYRVYINSPHGTVTATPKKGFPGTVVTLTNEPDSGWTFNGYLLDGEPIVGNTFIMPEHDVTVTANYVFNAKIRLKYRSGTTPTFSKGTGVLIDAANNIWELTYANPDWRYLLGGHSDLLEVVSADTTGVTIMSGLFDQCKLLNKVVLFDTSEVIDMGHMFFYCQELRSVPLYDTSKVTSMFGMFESCYKLVDVPSFDTSKVTNFSNTFHGCTSLTHVPNFNTSKATATGNMFYKCWALNTPPQLDLSKVTDTGGMFCYCYALPYIPLYDLSSVQRVSYMFQECHSVTTGALAMYNQLSTKQVEHYATFAQCGDNNPSGQAELARIPSDWK